MASSPRRSQRCVLAGIALTAVLSLAVWGRAQDESARSAEKGSATTPGKVAEPTDSKVATLHLVAKAEPQQTKEYIDDRLKKAKEHADGKFSWSEVVLEPLDPRTYKTLDEIIRQGKVTEVLQKVGKFDIAPFEGEVEGEWVVRLAKPHQVLKELKVTFEDDNKKDVRTFRPGTARAGEKSPLRFHSPGHYTLHMPADGDAIPTEYEATVEDGGKPVLPNPKNTFPKAERHWLITFKDFEGRFPALKKVLEDEKIMGNPFSHVAAAAQTTFVIGSLAEDDVQIIDWDFVGTKVTVRFNPLPRRDAKRVWMRFPISEGRIEEERKEWRAKDGKALLPGALSAAIAASADRVPSDKDESLVPGMAPKWFEIPLSADGSRFERALQLDNIEGWKKVANQPVYRLVGWEHEGLTGRREFLSIIHPRKARKTRVLLVDEPVEKWPVGVRALKAETARK